MENLNERIGRKKMAKKQQLTCYWSKEGLYSIKSIKFRFV